MQARREWRSPFRRGLTVLIADNGPGIAKEHRDHVFEPLFTTKGAAGTGIGLWVVQQIVEQYDGRIRLKSRVKLGNCGSCGTCFSIFFPFMENPGPAKSTDQALAE